MAKSIFIAGLFVTWVFPYFLAVKDEARPGEGMTPEARRAIGTIAVIWLFLSIGFYMHIT